MIYAGIDEAGYGPMFGPLIVGRAVFRVDPPTPNTSNTTKATKGTNAAAPPPDLWQVLDEAVCRKAADKHGRLAINDSKKLHSRQAGLRHLERGVLGFAALAGHSLEHVGQWLDCLGETAHRQLERLPWYAPCDERPWQAMPTCLTAGECQIARSMLTHASEKVGVTLLDIGAAVVFEDRFNQMVAATRSKAATSFTFVSQHLAHIWQQYGQPDAHTSACPYVIVDRQSGRTHYRELLALAFPAATIRVIDESSARSAYHLAEPQADGSLARQMTVSFEVDADGNHLPAALASMLSKYTRELLMHRFQAWFTEKLPTIKPTAGYATDGKRFWEEIQPKLQGLGIRASEIRRMS